ncbi:MAG TPA: 23S rRNA (uracil(1939)-C(5))-methyltransferase RlmD [Candidatus Polarisedimenticolia bacterium]|nr:23S rRNA (uracil(1939)-C(5))-methyltransferase RlmD [Candidatus Polarisedimenticolia bacterium]
MSANAEGPGPDGPPVEVGAETVVEITDLAFGGRGVARLAGYVIFVAGALPGESARARVTRVRRGYAEAEAVEIRRASPDRVTPPCRHYEECGGCDLQHLSPAAQARARRAQVAAILGRLGGLPGEVVHETIVAGDPWAYRFRMDFDWGESATGAAALGLHRRDRPGRIVPITDCLLMPEPGSRILRFLAAEARERRLESWSPRRRRGLLRRVGIQQARATGEILIRLETGRGDPPALAAVAAAVVRRFPRVVGVVRREINKGGEPAGDSILAGRDHLFEEVEEDRLMVPSGVFFQPNTAGVARLRREAVALLETVGGESILELYSGVGLFTLALARRAGEVLAVEGSREAVGAARVNIAKAGLGNVTLLHREVGAALPGLLRERTWHGLLLDPPRTGLTAATTRALAGSGVGRIVYVSCDPATLARDLRVLSTEGGFRIDSVTPFELFPQTGHIECVARLSKDPSSSQRAARRGADAAP